MAGERYRVSLLVIPTFEVPVKHLAFVSLFVVLLTGAPGDTAESRLPKPQAAAIARLLDQPDWRSARLGVCFARLDGTVLFTHDAQKLFVPASNAKLFTTALALAQLGPEFRFRTELKSEGEPDPDGTFRGNLHLVGAGDPSLMRADLAQFVTAVQRAGLRRIAGAVIADSSLITDGPYGFGWAIGYLPFYYQAEVRALSLDRNAVTLVVTSPGTEGRPAVITVEPPTDWVRIVNRVRVTQTGPTNVDFVRIAHQRSFEVGGVITVGAETVRQAVSIPEAHLFAADELRRQLNAAGVTTGDLRAETKSSEKRSLGVIESAPLAELAQRLNKVSDNLYAELFLRAAAYKAKGKATAADGSAALREWAVAMKLPADQLHLVDGSGLSRHNLVSPAAIVGLLQAMWRSPHREAFVQSLPVMGQDGTLATRMVYSAAHRVVRAKTGTLNGVSALSGYVPVGGQTYVVSIMVNNNTSTAARARKLQEEVLLQLMEAVRKRS